MDQHRMPSAQGQYSPPVPKLKDGHEPIRDEHGQSCGELVGFWRWAYSQTLDNTLRGVLAEYLVGLSLDVVSDKVRVEWDPFDLTTEDGVRVEVKSSSYLQSWVQKSPSILKFSVSETSAWDSASGTWGTGTRRQSDVYVFCAFMARDLDVANPLDTRQWDFYVAPTGRLNEELGNQKSIRLSELLRRVEPVKVVFSELADAVREAAAEP